MLAIHSAATTPLQSFVKLIIAVTHYIIFIFNNAINLALIPKNNSSITLFI